MKPRKKICICINTSKTVLFIFKIFTLNCTKFINYKRSLKIAIILVPFSQHHPKEPEPLISHNAQVTMTVWNRFLFFQLFSPSAWIACLHYTTSVTARLEGARTGLRLDMHCRPDHIMPDREAMKGYTTCFFVNWLLGSLQVYKNPEMHKQISRSPVNNTGALMMVTAFKRTAFLLPVNRWQLRRARRYTYNSGNTINAIIDHFQIYQNLH